MKTDQHTCIVITQVHSPIGNEKSSDVIGPRTDTMPTTVFLKPERTEDRHKIFGINIKNKG